MSKKELYVQFYYYYITFSFSLKILFEILKKNAKFYTLQIKDNTHIKICLSYNEEDT